jgi:hypothetical protein
MTNISYSSKGSLREPKQEDSFPMNYPEWHRLKGRIESIDHCGQLYLTAMGALIAIVASAVFGIISLQDNNPMWKGAPLFFIYLDIIIVGGVFLLLSAHYHCKLREMTNANKKDIIEEMNLIEAKFEGEPAAGLKSTISNQVV